MSEKLDLETAEAEFNRFADIMDLDVDPDTMTDEDKDSLSEHRRRLVKTLQNGALVINDLGEPVFTPRRSDNKEPVNFYEPTGESLMSMDRKKKNADISKTFAILGSMTKTNPKRFSSMKYGDLKVCSSILGLFMG